MMNEEELLVLIGLVFIKGKRDFPKVLAKNKMAEKIVNTSKEKLLSSKTLVNYYDYFFTENSKVTKPNPKSESISFLLGYIHQSTKQFKENKPLKESILQKVPIFKKEALQKENKVDKKEEKPTNNIGKINNTASSSVVVINKSFSPYWLLIFSVLLCTGIIGGFYIMGTFNKAPQVHIVNDLRQIVPTAKTQFFSPTTNQPMVWYASYNNKLEFFNNKGVHPINKEPLLPITKKMVNTYFIGKPMSVKKEETNRLTNTYQTKNSTPHSRYSTENKINITNKTTLDKELSLFFQENYTQTKEPYTCKGKVTYSFKKNTTYNQLFICNLSLQYTIVSNKTHQLINKGLIKSNGTGLTKNEAKQRAINRIQF